MKNESEIPTFAVVGHPNEGKSSVVATLTEDDSLGISDFPGETTVCSDYSVRVDDEILIRFLDTPGFQHPQKTLEWMQKHSAEGQHPAQAFVEAFRKDPEHHHDVELMIPLAAGAGIIYVVDGSRPMRKNDTCEMEILRMTGNPRMALINPKEGDESFLQTWKDNCAKSFNLTRIFNAHHAPFAERMALLESLKRMHQDWEPAMLRAVGAFERDWKKRVRDSAQIITDCLDEALEFQVEIFTTKRGNESEQRTKLISDYQLNISSLEKRAQSSMRGIYRHRKFRPTLPEQSIIAEDLFTERSWKMLGLNRKQVLMAAAILGGGAGAKLDILFANLSFGLFTVTGAALAVAGTWFKGENMARVKVKKLRLGGTILTVGPNRNPQFPFVLLDRLLLFYQWMIRWSHARFDVQDQIKSIEGEDKAGLSSQWSKKRRDLITKCFKRLKDEKLESKVEAEGRLIAELEIILWELSTETTGNSRGEKRGNE
jgi:hypothetical protein